MTVKELVTCQQNGEKIFFIRIGLFYQAYDEAALYLAEITGYKVRQEKAPLNYVLGFPTRQLQHVKDLLLNYHVVIQQENDKQEIYSFIPHKKAEYKGKITLKKPAPKQKKMMSHKKMQEVYRLVMAYQTDLVTPLQAINFIRNIQKNYG